MRAFVAAPADSAWVESADRLASPLRATLPRASWTRPAAWHLTLRFLGEIGPEAADRLLQRLQPVAESAPAHRLTHAGAVVLPPRGRPRVLGLGFATSEALSALARGIEGAVRGAGLAPEDRPFHPHVTLARLRDPWPAPAVEAFRREADGWTLPAWNVKACVLFESRLDPAGAVHVPVRTFALAVAAKEIGA